MSCSGSQSEIDYGQLLAKLPLQASNIPNGKAEIRCHIYIAVCDEDVPLFVDSARRRPKEYERALLTVLPLVGSCDLFDPDQTDFKTLIEKSLERVVGEGVIHSVILSEWSLREAPASGGQPTTAP